MGLFIDARRAGYIPKINPITVETPTPNNAPDQGEEKGKFSPANLLIKIVPA